MKFLSESIIVALRLMYEQVEAWTKKMYLFFGLNTFGTV